MSAHSLDSLLERQPKGAPLLQEFYSDPEIFERDIERIHLRHWLCVGHESRASEAAMLFRKTECEPAELRELLPVLSAEPELACRELLPMVETVAVPHEPVDAVPEELLLVVQREVHRAAQRPSTILAMMFF